MKTDSSPELNIGTQNRNETPTREIALWRIYFLRAGYLLIAVGMGMQKVPAFIYKPIESTALFAVNQDSTRARISSRVLRSSPLNKSPTEGKYTFSLAASMARVTLLGHWPLIVIGSLATYRRCCANKPF